MPSRPLRNAVGPPCVYACPSRRPSARVEIRAHACQTAAARGRGFGSSSTHSAACRQTRRSRRFHTSGTRTAPSAVREGRPPLGSKPPLGGSTQQSREGVETAGCSCRPDSLVPVPQRAALWMSVHADTARPPEILKGGGERRPKEEQRIQLPCTSQSTRQQAVAFSPESHRPTPPYDCRDAEPERKSEKG